MLRQFEIVSQILLVGFLLRPLLLELGGSTEPPLLQLVVSLLDLLDRLLLIGFDDIRFDLLLVSFELLFQELL
jgi:hypothetical protein